MKNQKTNCFFILKKVTKSSRKCYNSNEGDIMFENKKIFIFGMARSGYEAALFLSKHHNEILIVDGKEQDEEHVRELSNLGVSVVITEHPEELLDDSYDVMIKNPGIIQTHPCVKKAHDLKIPVINEVEMAYHFLPKNVTIIAITGSNGKTTTTTITYEMLKYAGLPVYLGGNIGTPLSKLVEQIQENSFLVMEISDHQLVDMKEFHPHIAVLTNLSQVHLDFHLNSYERYKQTKKKLFLPMNEEDIAILNMENKDVMDLTKDLTVSKRYFSSQKDADACIKDQALYVNQERIIGLDEIRVKGIHNYENIMCATMIAKECGVSDEVICEVLKTFVGVEHRLEFVCKLNGREFYNDSKSTNNQSTITALESFNNPVILLLGGLDRGIPFDELTPYMEHVTHVVCYGETKNKIKEYCDKIGKDCTVLNTLEESVHAAYHLSNEGDTILFSPACASWDQFNTFEERGETFKKVVNELK